MRAVLLLLVLGLALTVASEGRAGDTMPTIHIFPHSHCDAGWQVTFEEYYTKNVTHILTSLTHELSKNPRRRHSWAETSFLARWWQEQNDDMRAKYRALVEGGQIEFVGGGWVQSDESVADLYGRVVQMQAGHEFLQRTFPNHYPRVAWQMDSFGASQLSPALFHLEAFAAAVFQRMDYSLQNKWRKEKTLDFDWEFSPSYPKKSLRSHNLGGIPGDDYCTPAGFDWSEPPYFYTDTTQNPPVTAANVHERSLAFKELMSKWVSWFADGPRHVLFPLGCDFRYQNAAPAFDNMDQIIDHINANPAEFGLRLRYSTPSEYFAALDLDGAAPRPTFRGDFTPFRSDLNSTWSGYYAQQEPVKLLTRQVQGLHRAAEAIFALGVASGAVGPAEDQRALTKGLGVARQEIGILMHHDAITGTSPHAVMDDYTARLERARDMSGRALTAATQGLLGASEGLILPGATSLASGAEFVFPIVNPLPWVRRVLTASLSLEAAPATLISVQGPEGLVPCQVSAVDGREAGAALDVKFSAKDIPALGYAAYGVAGRDGKGSCVVVRPRPATAHTVKNSCMAVHVEESGAVTVTKAGQETTVNLSGFARVNPTGNPWILHLDGSALPVMPRRGAMLVEDGPVETNVILPMETGGTFEYTIVVSIARAAGDEACGQLQVRHLFPRDIDSRVEIFARYSLGGDARGSDILTVDSGLEEHVRPIYRGDDPAEAAAHVYPVIGRASLTSGARRMTVHVGQSQGVSSPRPGELQMLVHRAVDADYTVVGRPVVNQHWLDIAPGPASYDPASPRTTRRLTAPPVALRTASPATLAQWVGRYGPSKSFIRRELPLDIDVLSLAVEDGQVWGAGNSLAVSLRLHHVLPATAQSASTIPFDPTALLPSSIPSAAAAERSLSLLHPWKAESDPVGGTCRDQSPDLWESDSTRVCMAPLAIRTFLLTPAATPARPRHIRQVAGIV